jgi:hypothetical protein
MRSNRDMSPRMKARLAGLSYLVTIVAGLYAQGFIAERLFESGDAAATAANILNHQSQFRTGFAVYLVEMTAQVTMMALMYELLKPVSKGAALLSTAFGFIGCTIKIVSRLFYYAPILVLGGSPYLTVFSREQLNALALLLLKVNDQGAAIALIFFGFGTLLKAYLILRSTFWPRFLGVLSALGGVGWLTYLWPPLGAQLFFYVAAVGLLGAVATIAWLLIVGVHEERWTAQARAAQASIWW